MKRLLSVLAAAIIALQAPLALAQTLTLLGAGATGCYGGAASSVLLLHADGTNGSTSFTDSSASNHTMTANGGIVIDTAQLKFGTASGKSPGAVGDYLSTPMNADFQFGSGAFTIDLWFRLSVQASTNTEPFALLSLFTDDSNVARLSVNNGGNELLFQQVDAAVATINLDGTTAISASTWYEAAVTRSGNVWRLFLNGTQEATTTNAAAFTAYTATLNVGSVNQGNNWLLQGWFDEVHIIKGTAQWTAGFAAPSQAYCG